MGRMSERPLTVPQLFHGLAAEEFEALCKRWVSVTFPAETVLCKPHQRGQVLYLVRRGRVALYDLWQGEKQVRRALGAGAIFGRMPLVGELMPDCFVATAAETEVLILSRAAVEQLIRQRPEVGLRVLAEVGPRLVGEDVE